MVLVEYTDGTSKRYAFSDETDIIYGIGEEAALPIRNECEPTQSVAGTLWTFKESPMITSITYVDRHAKTKVDRAIIPNAGTIKFYVARCAALDPISKATRLQYTRVGVIDSGTNFNEYKIYPNGEVKHEVGSVAQIIAASSLT